MRIIHLSRKMLIKIFFNIALLLQFLHAKVLHPALLENVGKEHNESNKIQLLKYNITIFQQNIEDVGTNFDLIQEHIAKNNNYDIIVLTETYRSNYKDKRLFNLKGYDIIDTEIGKNSSCLNEGVIVYLNSSIFKQKYKTEFVEIEKAKGLKITITKFLNKKDLIITAIYRPVDAISNVNIFIKELEAYAIKNKNNGEHIFLGNTNIDLLSGKAKKNYLNALKSFKSEINNVTLAKEEASECDDHIFLKDLPKDVVVEKNVIETNIDDHNATFLEVNINDNQIYKLKRSISVFQQNVHSANKNFKKARTLILDRNPSVIVLTETFRKAKVYNSANYKLEKYDKFETNIKPTHTRNEGVLMYVKSEFKVPKNIDYNADIEECNSLSIPVKLDGNTEIRFTGIYRRPKSSKSIFIKSLNNFLKKHANVRHVLLGDINIDLLKSDTYQRDYTNMLKENLFESEINDPTRVTPKTATIIDHVFVSEALHNNVVGSEVIDAKVSDHRATLIKIEIDGSELQTENLQEDLKWINYVSPLSFMKNLTKFFI